MAIEVVCAIESVRSAAAETRPWIASGVRVCSAVEKPTIAQAMPTPANGPAGEHDAERRRDQAEVGDARRGRGRAPTRRTSPSRRSIAAAVTPPAIEPMPWNVAKTPKNDGGFPSAVDDARRSASRRSRRRAARRRRRSRPGAAAGSPRRGAARPSPRAGSGARGGAGFSSCTRMRDEEEDAEPRTSRRRATATAPPPNAA